MPRFLYTVSARADVLETWAVESDKPLTADEFMEVFNEGDASKLFFVTDEVDGNEEERIFKECLGEAPAETEPDVLDALKELTAALDEATDCLDIETAMSSSRLCKARDAAEAAIAKAQGR